MKHEIKKLNQLQHTDSFMQINYLRGFKYIDKAGEIVNTFFTDKVEPPYQMSQRALIIKEDEASSKTYKVAVNNVWYHNSEPENFGNLENDFRRKATDILNLLEVEEITRIGWRNYFIYELQNLEEKNAVLRKLLPIARSEFSNLGFEVVINGFKCKFIVEGAEKQDESKTPAIIFDIDCSFNFTDSPIDVEDIAPQLENIRDVYNSKDILEIINLVLNAGGDSSNSEA